MSGDRFWPLFGRVLLGWIMLAVLVAAASLIFRAFDSNYLRWYIDNGSTIALATAFLTLVIELEYYEGLISAHPLVYLREVCFVLATWYMTLSTAFATPGKARRLPIYPALAELFDVLAAGILSLIVGIVLIAWFLFVVPAQYFVFLVCGAPARVAASSPQVLWAVDRDLIPVEKSAAPPARAVRLSFAAKPVGLTNAFAAAVLWGVGQLV